MDVLTFLKQGNVSTNPNYNPKTKKGALEPPYLVNYNPGQSTSDIGRANITKSATPTIYDLNRFQDGQYYEHNVIPNLFDTEEELNKERAENQGAMEQFGRFLGQTVGSEIVLGTLRGFSDLADAAINIYGEITDDEHINDYTNPVSETLANAQNSIRERLAIYEEDPNGHFNILDSGWWFNGLTTIASTLSLAIPGTAIAKLGKLAGLGRVARGVGKIVGKPFGQSQRFGLAVEQGADMLGRAALMRTAENYMEARDTYETLYGEISNRLTSMTDSQKEKFFEDNPEFVGKTDEEIAKYLAGEGADDVFRNDFGLMLLDAWQLKALKGVWRGSRSINANDALRQANRNFGRRLVGLGDETVSKGKRLANFLNLNSLSTLGAELSEGFEEAYQYYQQQNAIDEGINIVDNAHRIKTLNDYLSDPEMWENAFWGWIGGVAFQNISSATGRAWNKYVAKAKDATTEGRKAEIESRAATIQDYINRMNILEQGYDPDTPIRDDEGNIITGENGGYREIDDVTKEAKKQIETERLVTKLTLNAARAGNYDLLKEFVTSEEFDKYMTDSNVMEEADRKAFLTNITNKMEETYEEYSKQLRKVYKNDVANPSIASRIAEENTINGLVVKEIDREIAGYQNALNASVNTYTNNQTRDRIAQLEGEYARAAYELEVNETVKQENQIKKDLADKKISKIEAEFLLNKTAERKLKFANAAGYNSVEEMIADNPNHLTLDQSANDLKSIDEEVFNNIRNKSFAERRKILVEEQINDTKDKIKSRSKLIENTFKIAQDQSFRDSLDELDAIFDNNDIGVVENYIINKKDDSNTLTPEVKKKLDKLTRDVNVFNPGDAPLIDIISRKAQAARARKANKPAATVNGNATNTPPPAASNTPPPPSGNAGQRGSGTAASSPSPTGGQPGTPAASGTNNNQQGSSAITAGTTPQGGTAQQGTNPPAAPPAAAPEGLAGSSPVEDDANADNDIESVVKRQAEEERQYFEATSIINDHALNRLMRNRDRNLTSLSVDEQINTLTQELIDQGVDRDLIDANLPRQVQSINMLLNRMDAANQNHESAIDIEIARALSDEESRRNQHVKDLLNEYLQQTHGLRVNINGKSGYALSIARLMKYISDNVFGSNVNPTLFAQIYDVVATELRNGIEGIHVLDERNLNLGVDQISRLIQNAATPENKAGTRMNISRDGGDYAISVLSEMNIGDEIYIDVTRNKDGSRGKGVDFYAIDSQGHRVKIGFNFKPEPIDSNGGYRFKSSRYAGITYTLRRVNGVVQTELNPIFEALYPFTTDQDTGEQIQEERSDEAQQLIDIMFAIKRGDVIPDEKIKQFLNTSLADKLYAISSNKNKNYNTLNEIIKYINSIYFYDESGDYINDYLSYNNWITGQYDNYEMTSELYEAVINNKPVTVKIGYISRGTLLGANPNVGPQNPSIALANYNSQDYHLATVPVEGYVEDANNGNQIAAPGFKPGRLMVIVENGNNAPTFVPVIPNKLDLEGDKLGAIIRDEMNKIIKDYLQRNVSYADTLKKLTDIFGVRKLVTGINVGEHEGKIVIYRNGDNFPIITLYRYSAEGVEQPGISANFTPWGGETRSASGYDGTFDNNIETIVRNVLGGATFALSYDFAQRNSKGNGYISFNNDKMQVNIGDKHLEFDNYLDFIDKQGIGVLNTSTITLANGQETNFVLDSNAQVRLDYSKDSRTDVTTKEEQDRLNFLDAEQAKGTHVVESATDFLKSAAPQVTFNSDATKELLPDRFIIDVEDTGNRDAYYDLTNDVVVVTKGYFDKARRQNSGWQEAVRILMHERIHQQIASHDVMSSEQFVNEIRQIRDAFADIVNNGAVPESLQRFINANNYNTEDLLRELRKFVDYTSEAYSGKSDEYLLEEFVVEALTRPILSQVLNNIDSIHENNSAARETLWTRIINWIRELFGLGDINANTLLNDVYVAFANNFDDGGNIDNKLNADKTDEETGSSPVEDGTNAPDNPISLVDDIIPDETDMFDGMDIPMSAIDVNPNSFGANTVMSATSQMTAGEAAQFAQMLDRGDINYRCY